MYLGIVSYDFAVRVTGYTIITTISGKYISSNFNIHFNMIFCCFIGDQEKNKLHLLLEIYRATSYKFLQTKRS